MTEIHEIEIPQSESKKEAIDVFDCQFSSHCYRTRPKSQSGFNRELKVGGILYG